MGHKTISCNKNNLNNQKYEHSNIYIHHSFEFMLYGL